MLTADISFFRFPTTWNEGSPLFLGLTVLQAGHNHPAIRIIESEIATDEGRIVHEVNNTLGSRTPANMLAIGYISSKVSARSARCQLFSPILRIRGDLEVRAVSSAAWFLPLDSIQVELSSVIMAVKLTVQHVVTYFRNNIDAIEEQLNKTGSVMLFDQRFIRV